MTLIPKDRKRETLLKTLKHSWGKSLTNKEIEIVICGSDRESMNIIQKKQLSMVKAKK